MSLFGFPPRFLALLMGSKNSIVVKKQYLCGDDEQSGQRLLCRLRRGGGRQSQDVRGLYARQVLRRNVPKEALAGA